MNWLELNRRRAYPFIYQAQTRIATAVLESFPEVTYADGMILDAGFLLGPDSLFDPGIHRMAITGLLLLDGLFYIEVKPVTTVVGNNAMPGHHFLFKGTATPLINGEYLTLRIFATPVVTLPDDSYSSVDELDPAPYMGSAFLTLGPDFLDWLPPSEGSRYTVDSDDYTFEPAITQSLYKSVVRSIKAGNQKRLVLESCPGAPAGPCSPETLPDTVPYLNDFTLTGDVTLVEGYNCDISLRPAVNTITIGARIGAGKGAPCGGSDVYYGEIPISTGEQCKVTNQVLLSGGPKCSELIFQINGTVPETTGNLQVQGDNGITVISDADNNKLVISLNCENMLIGCDAMNSV